MIPATSFFGTTFPEDGQVQVRATSFTQKQLDYSPLQERNKN